MASGLAVLITMAITIIAWIQFHQRYGRVLLCHAIIATLAFLFSLYALLYFMGVKKNLTTNKETPPLTSIIIFIGAMLFAAYFVGSSIYLWVYRGHFENYT